MDAKAPTYEELEARLAQAESTLQALSSESIDAVVGQKGGVYLLRLNEMEKALRESEEKFRKAFVNAAVGFVLSTPGGRFVEANAAFCAVTGYDAEELKGCDAGRLIHPDDYAENVRLVERLVAGQIPHFILENRYVRKDGEVVWVRKSSSLVRDAAGLPQWTITLVEDITDRKRFEDSLAESLDELKQLEAELRQKNAELTEFSYALTHNLKAPLRAVQNYANFLFEDLSGMLQEEQAKFLEGIRIAARGGHDQITDLETLYRIKDHQVCIEAFAADELFDEMQSIFRHARDGGLVVSRSRFKIMGERHLLRQVLIELIRNGFKFNQSDKKRVEIGCQPAPDNRIEFYVRDNGIGIPQRYHEQVFRVFQRLHTDREYKGTGIGLAIVKRAVQKMGGSIGIESAAGQGSSFVVRLPSAMIET